MKLKKRKINPQYLRSITARDVEDSPIDALDFAISIKEFADEYLRGLMSARIEGTSRGDVHLKLPVVTYLIRILCEIAAENTMVDVRISMGERLILRADYEKLGDVEDVAYMVRVARLAGFEVTRDKNSFAFAADIKITSVMHVYATSMLDFKNMLITTYKM